MNNQGVMTEQEHEQKMKTERLSARITNSTPENIIVYGPKRATDSGNYDKSWYILHPGETTPDKGEFEGLFIPKDRKLEQETTGVIQGPAAVRYSVAESVKIIKDGNQYLENGGHNQGVYHANEINWPIPDFSSEDCANMTSTQYEVQQ